MAIFMKVAGVDGESFIKGRESWIEVLSFQWMVGRNLSSIGSSVDLKTTGKGAARFEFQGIQITKTVDSASNPLFLAAARGDVIQPVILEFTGMGVQSTGPEVVRVRYRLGKVIIASIEQAGTGSDLRLLETLTLQFGSFVCEYANQAGTPVNVAGWDVALARAI